MNKVYDNSNQLNAYIAIKWLMAIKGIGRKNTIRIIDEIKDFRILAEGTYEALKGYEQIIGKPLRSILPLRDSELYKEIYILNTVNEEGDIKRGIITYWDENYPKILKELHDPPVVLYYKGNISLLEESILKVAIVGTRVPSEYGRKYGSLISHKLSNLGYAIVSGMAMGIDAVAHKGAIEHDGFSIGVLGCGLDLIYPKQNERIYQQLLKKGLLISEYEKGVQPHPIHFPERNRLIAGLSEACLVIEAAKKSGSLITAEMALDLGRDVFALPGPIYSSKSIGCHELIKNGATPIISVEDLEKDFSKVIKPSEHEGFDRTVQSHFQGHYIIDYLASKGEATLEEVISELRITISEALEELDNLVLNNQVQMKGFLYHL